MIGSLGHSDRQHTHLFRASSYGPVLEQSEDDRLRGLWVLLDKLRRAVRELLMKHPEVPDLQQTIERVSRLYSQQTRQCRFAHLVQWNECAFEKVLVLWLERQSKAIDDTVGAIMRLV